MRRLKIIRLQFKTLIAKILLRESKARYSVDYIESLEIVRYGDVYIDVKGLSVEDREEFMNNKKVFERLDAYKWQRDLERKIEREKQSLKIVHLFALIPKSCRQETIADIQEIILDMKREGCSKYYIGLIVTLNIVSVVYHGLFFKLKGYFYPSAEQSNNG